MIRLLAALGLIGLGFGVAGYARVRDRRRIALAPLTLDGVDGRVIFFSDGACKRCPKVRGVLEESGIEFTEIGFDREPETFNATQAAGVPLVVARRADGSEAGRIAGSLNARSLDRLLTRAGLVDSRG
jgi:hypothetical protein